MIVGKIGIRLMDEVKFTTAKINENFSNYSSWHYRSTLRNLTEENVESELMLVQNAVFTDPEDSSPWFYLRWVLSNKGVTQERRVELLRTLNELLDLDPECKCIIYYCKRRDSRYGSVPKILPLEVKLFLSLTCLANQKVRSVTLSGLGI